LIKDKGDLRIDAGVSLIPTANATISYGLTEKIAVQTFASIGSDHPYYLQGAIGLFKHRGNSIITEWYAGAGTGEAKVTDSSDPGKLEGTYQVYFTQFNFGKVNSEFLNADYGIGLKAGYINSKFTDMDYFSVYNLSENIHTFDYPVQNDNGFLFQPAAFARFGKDNLKINLKLGGLVYYQFTNQEHKLPVAHFNAGVSLNYFINTKKP
jgi:hypothetical protein